MSRFFDYNNPICIEGQSPSVFSFDPYIQALKDLLMHEIQQISYYTIKLREMDYDITEERNRVIHFISIVIANLDFKRTMFNIIIEDLRNEKNKLKKIYSDTCKEKDKFCEPLVFENLSEKDSNFDIIYAINQDEKQSIIRNSKLPRRKKLIDTLMVNLVRNACLYLVEIENYDKAYEEGENAVIDMLNTMNFNNLNEDELYEEMIEFTNMNTKIIKKLEQIVLDKYGPIEEEQMNLSHKEGKAILVTGHFLKDLETVLEATKDDNINVYTHGDMIIAHSMKYFKRYPHLVGHYQRAINNVQLDFASFPGVILISKNSQPHTDIIRGRLFTFDKHPAYGMQKINQNNLTPLINAAKEAKGFKTTSEINTIHVGFNQNTIIEKLDKIIERIKSGNIKNLYIVDMYNTINDTSVYINKFFSLMPDDSFAISLSYPSDNHNVWYIDSHSGVYVFYILLNKLAESFDLKELNITVLLTKCDFKTISHIVNLKRLNIENIYLGNCCPGAVSPALTEATKEIFGIKAMTNNPAQDLKEML